MAVRAAQIPTSTRVTQARMLPFRPCSGGCPHCARPGRPPMSIMPPILPMQPMLPVAHMLPLVPMRRMQLAVPSPRFWGSPKS